MFTMMKYLQKECDRQARKILQHFRKHREFDVRTQQVQQSFMLGKTNVATEK